MGVKRNLDESGILEDSTKITVDEAALYDRQIRLWGMDCQKRLREVKILVVGLNGVTAEVIKNLALIGVKQITMLDDTEVTPADFTAQFSLSSEDIGKPRAESSVSAFQELNPNVTINVLTGDIFSKSDEVYKGFHAMVAADCSVDVLIKLDKLCRSHGLQFYCTDTWGFYGYFFLDLQIHDFKSTVKITDNIKSDKQEKPKEITVDMRRKYCLLGPTLMTKVGEGLRKRVNKVFVLIHVVNHFREIHNRYPNPESRESDIEELKKLRTIVCEKLEYDASKIPNEILGFLFGQLSPVCAALGGTLANEIIKGISKFGVPIHNYFLFDGLECLGVNETIIIE